MKKHVTYTELVDSHAEAWALVMERLDEFTALVNIHIDPVMDGPDLDRIKYAVVIAGEPKE